MSFRSIFHRSQAHRKVRRANYGHAGRRARFETFEDRQMLSLNPAVNYPVDTEPLAVVAADFNNDGRVDLATANSGNNTISVLLGNANGTFHKGGATEFRTRIDERTQNVRSTSYGMTQRYSLAGNILTQNYQPTGEVVKSKIRVYYTKYDKDAWQHKIGFLPLGGGDGGALVLRRSE